MMMQLNSDVTRYMLMTQNVAMMSSLSQLFTTRYGGACDYDYNVHCGDRPVCDDCDENCQYHPQGVYE